MNTYIKSPCAGCEHSRICGYGVALIKGVKVLIHFYYGKKAITFNISDIRDLLQEIDVESES